MFIFVRHKAQEYPHFTLAQHESTETTSANEDFLFNYHKSKLVVGLTLFEFDDTIKEGDGERLHKLYNFALLIFKANGKSKYSYVIFLYLVKLGGLLSEKGAHNLKRNKFYNKHGIKGGNIPVHLRMEHMNKDVKTTWKALGSNINEKSAERVANTVEPMELIMDSTSEWQTRAPIVHQLSMQPSYKVRLPQPPFMDDRPHENIGNCVQTEV